MKMFTFSFLFFLLIHIVQAQQGFSSMNVIISSDAGAAQFVFSEDIDNDGDLDIIYASSGNNTIGWYENIDGEGQFGPGNTITDSAFQANSVFAVDLDNDGDVDVISSSAGDNTIAWYENIDGEGDFSSPINISSSCSGVQSVHAADLDGDNDIDVLCASENDNTIAWFENTDGKATFSSANIITNSAYGAQCVYAADLDGDGNIDVLSASENDNKIAWYENTNGQGDFGPPDVITISAEFAEAVYAVDLDGDNDKDVLVASAGENYVTWYENTDGFGDFGSARVIAGDYGWASSVFAADLDEDGDNDVISADGSDNTISVYENTNGLGEFGIEQIITSIAKSARAVFAEDLNNDGFIDILSASAGDDKIAWYKNTDGQGSYSSQIVVSEQGANGANAVYSADIDNDGDYDVLSASKNDSTIAWYENINSAESFGSKKVISDSAVDASSVFAVDIDGDGDIDVLSASSGDDKVAWYENLDGKGSFGKEVIISNSVRWANSVFSIDLDGDEDNDVLATSPGLDKVIWFENLDGQGKFGSMQIISSTAISARSVYAKDLNGDDEMDVLSASAMDDKIAWYENTDGDGTFSSERVISTNAHRAVSVFAADLDGDNDNDVLSASSGDNKIAWYENHDGQGNFGPQKIVSAAVASAQSVFSIDLDGDGDNDILSASYNDNKVAWYENLDGQGNYSSQQIITNAANGSYSVFSIDLDNDGDNDVLSASSNDDKIAWYMNLSVVMPEIIKQPGDTTICPMSYAILGLSAENTKSYQWQIYKEGTFSNLENNSVYSGVNKDTLIVFGLSEEMDSSAYRCLLSNSDNTIISDTIMITLLDNEDPIIAEGVKDQVVVADSNCKASLPDYTSNIEVWDNCDENLEIIQSPPPGTMISGSSNSVTLHVSDDLDNQAETSFNVEVTDTTAPFITCPGNTILMLQPGQDLYVANETEFNPIEITDNCGVQSAINDFNESTSLDNTSFSAGSTTVIWEVTDESGNKAYCNFTVTINEATVIESITESVISLFPNPAENFLHYEYSNYPVIEIRIADLRGKTFIQVEPDEERGTINIAGLKDGVYIVYFRTTKGIVSTKFIKIE